MTATAAITGRELRAYFLSPGGYVVAALLMVVTAAIFVERVFIQGDPASMRPIFILSMIVCSPIYPAITMRAVSEELRMGTVEMLLTSPIRTADVILGKYAAAMGFLAVLMLPTLCFVGILELYGRPDYGELACGYAGVLLAGSAFLASGILFSCLTASQVVAYLLTFLFWLLGLLATTFLPAKLYAMHWSGVGDVIASLNPLTRLGDFAIGLFDLSNFVYFASLTIVMLIMAVCLLDARRWR